MAFQPRQTSVANRVSGAAGVWLGWAETWLEGEREQIALWVPIGLGSGIAAWFMLPALTDWLAFCAFMLALACAALILPAGGRLRRMVVSGGLLACIGCLLIWGKASLLGQPPLARPLFTQVTAQVRSVESLPARGIVRLTLRPLGTPHLPAAIRVNVADADLPVGAGTGAVIRFRVRLMPPAPPALPGGFDFARRAYFQGIGATGKALKPIEVIEPSMQAPTLRARLARHIQSRLPGGEGGIAVALATGDQGAIPETDAEAMRRSGLAHLLSISGLHVTALIGAVMVLLLRAMALSRRAALGLPLVLIAAGGGALAGLGYTMFTGAEVPTVRSCVAALLVLGALALGRDAITLRLVAAGAMIVLLLWPEALVGPSFQMSFAAIVAIVALTELPLFRAFALARDEVIWRRWGRAFAAMLLTGLAVEIALMPIALFHFHKAGMLGAFANLIAIPLTTFVIMPLEALALAADLVGLGTPFWWLAGHALSLLLGVAHTVAVNPAAVLLTPAMPGWTFALIVTGGTWCMLWRGRARAAGLVPVLIAMIAIGMAGEPDLLVTADGRHVAVRLTDGRLAILRARAGDYVRDMLSGSAGYDGDLAVIADLPEARCSTDLCLLPIGQDTQRRTLLLTRTPMLVERPTMQRDCAKADIVVSDRRLPHWCRPRWLRIDRGMLARTGGLSIDLDRGAVRAAATPADAHPWIVATAPEHRRIRRPTSRPTQL
ncbi:MAG: ComEC/Rec2 family competence protein [Sphingobium sp.]